MFLSTVFVLVALHIIRAVGAPFGTGNQTSFSVTNFQDLSAVISLLAADTVENKFCGGSSFDWERMSSVWSIFGMVGVLRANLKIAASLSGSERAGLALNGAGVFTARRTANSLCYWQVGRANNPLSFRDSTEQLLSRLDSHNSPWIRPICIALGYSQCPWDWKRWRCIWELIHPGLWMIFTAVITTLPTLILVPLGSPAPIHILILGLQLTTGFVVGPVLPFLMHRLNSNGVANLTLLDSIRSERAGIIRPGDHIVTSMKTGVCHLIWQSTASEAAPRSGDSWIVRCLAAFNVSVILGAYLTNYIALGDADFLRQYAWLGCQIVILAVRFILWAHRPVWSPRRPPCLLYMVTGSLGKQLPADPPHTRISNTSKETLDEPVIEFAVASASSKQCNQAFRPARVRRDALLNLVDAPADIIHAEYASIPESGTSKDCEAVFIVRLSWTFVEELYMAQGVILGNNPWALGGLYLGAILSDGRFVGLTTLHEFSAHVSECQDEQCISEIHPHRATTTITFDGYLVSDKTYGQVLGPFQASLEPSLLEWHHKFRNNVDLCRRTSRANGPSHVEIHASTFGPIPNLRTNIIRTEQSIDLGFVKDAVEHARTKSHESCDEWVCEVDRFAYGDLGPKERH
ncbi:hypothetical protein B0H19DRAFT_942600 [Mycena capillaripes]|nr:hypothetical protein B0H19DRAFT_942600 [Mycena capillaripes]